MSLKSMMLIDNLISPNKYLIFKDIFSKDNYDDLLKIKI